ncbi:hypothetical protein P354_21230 [Streptomyces noursei PD-1]|nr:hypothetical protein P354_21230 [Streptomyces noursei PD-1]
MGTEQVGPFLYQLLQLFRPRHVLEVGMGYTTPFIAAALASAEAQSKTEILGLVAKTKRHLHGDDLSDDWLIDEPALLAPGEYLEPHLPCMVAVDDLSIGQSSASRAHEVLRELGLDRYVEVVNASLHEAESQIVQSLPSIDFAWVDAWECLYFFDHFWHLIDGDGGIVAMHYLMTYPGGEALIEYFQEYQRSHPGELEVLNILEPHKLMQNSITLLRKTTDIVPRPYSTDGVTITYSERLLNDAHEVNRRNVQWREN